MNQRLRIATSAAPALGCAMSTDAEYPVPDRYIGDVVTDRVHDASGVASDPSGQRARHESVAERPVGRVEACSGDPDADSANWRVGNVGSLLDQDVERLARGVEADDTG